MLNVIRQFVKQKARGRPIHPIVPAPHAFFTLQQLRSPTTAPPQVTLPQQLAELQRRSCDVLSHHLLKHPAAGSLRTLGTVLHEKTLRIQDVWRRIRSARETTVELRAELNEYVTAAHRLLDVIVGQLHLCSASTSSAVTVSEFARRINSQEYVKFHSLLPLVDRICDEVRELTTLRAATPISGLSLTALVDLLSPGTEAGLFVAGLTTARVLACVFRDDLYLVDRLPQILLAALFQDVGKLSLANSAAATRAGEHEGDWLVRQHPAIGAGLLGAVRGAPVELAMLVAQHHEQLNGHGFPRSLPRVGILPEAAILAAAVRFAALCLDQTSQQSAGATLDYARTSAARTLVAEAEWGHWRPDVVRRIADQVAVELVDDAPLPIEIPGQSVAPLAATSDQYRQLHDQEPGLQGTHSEHAAKSRMGGNRSSSLSRQPL